MRDNRKDSDPCAQVLEALETRWVDGFEISDTAPENYETFKGEGSVTEPPAAMKSAEDWDIALRLGELHEPTRPVPGNPGTVSTHLQVCSECRSAATDLQNLHHSLQGGFHQLEHGVALPSKERINELIRRVNEDSGVRLLRRLKRSLRIVIWGAFYGFTLLLCCVLAVALWKVITALGN